MPFQLISRLLLSQTSSKETNVMTISAIISVIQKEYPNAERDGFSFASVDSTLSIKINGTDVHRSLRDDASNKDQIDLTYGDTLPDGTSPVDDFFPTVIKPKNLPQSRHLKLACKIWGECVTAGPSEWLADENDVVRLNRNEGRNPSLQLRGMDRLRKVIPEDDWLIIAHQKGATGYHAFSLKDGLWTNPSGRSKEVLVGKTHTTQITYALDEVSETPANGATNTIYFGPPGTGKSTIVHKKVGSAPMFRTQFHPEYTHADLIGSYRPVVGSEAGSGNTILSHDGHSIPRPVNYFAFVPGPLALALESAFETNEHVYLVVEEINRGDCAAIFGDIFQLLDRDDSGQSEFGITPKVELLAYFRDNDIQFNIEVDGKLYLPPNLSLLATMNTSDQSLYPMDAAFKRRWQWVSCPIDFNQLLQYTAPTCPFLDDGSTRYDWIDLLKSINKNIIRDRIEDKQLGPWFIKPSRDGSVSWDEFLNKCLFYLWHDVFRDEQLFDLSPFKSDGPEVFDEAQANIRANGLAAGFKPELLSASETNSEASTSDHSDSSERFAGATVDDQNQNP
jgi:hypothetical protein